MGIAIDLLQQRSFGRGMLLTIGLNGAGYNFHNAKIMAGFGFEVSALKFDVKVSY